jgi:hypothetical protein
MKKLLPLIIIVFATACDMRNPQQKAERLVEDYLANKYATGTQYSILKNTKVDTIFAPGTTASKSGGRPIIGWYIYTTYINKNAFGGLASHNILVTTDADCVKITKVTERGH